MAEQIFAFLIIIAIVVLSGYAIYLGRRINPKKGEGGEIIKQESHTVLSLFDSV